MTLLFEELIAQENIYGAVGTKVIILVDGRFVSPIKSEHVWEQKNDFSVAKCIGAQNCPIVPNRTHTSLGCGFYALLSVGELRSYVKSGLGAVRGQVCHVLVELKGKIFVHKKGFRAAQARIAYVLTDILTPQGSTVPYQAAAEYFKVPWVDGETGQQIINYQYDVHREVFEDLDN